MTGGVNSVKKPLYFITFDYVDNEILFERDENGSLTVEQQIKLSNLSVGKYKCVKHSIYINIHKSQIIFCLIITEI